MDDGRHDGPYQGRDQEDPDLAERRATDHEGRPEAPGRVHRGARQRNADEVHDHQPEADGHAGGSLNGCLVRGEQDHHDEDGCQDDLNEEGAPLAHEQVRLLAVPVRTESLDRLLVEGRRGEHPVEEVGPGDAARHLGHDVGHALAQLHPPRGDEAERDRRVDVATRDRPDGVDEGDEHEPEGQGGGGHPGRIAQAEELEAEGLGGDADGDGHQYQRAEELHGELPGIQIHDDDLLCPRRGERTQAVSQRGSALSRIPAMNYLLTASTQRMQCRAFVGN